MKIKTYGCVLKEQNELELRQLCVRDSRDVYDIMYDLINDACEEYAHIIMVNIKGEIIGISEVSHGDLSGTLVMPREIFKRALLGNAAGIILTHNHPSGDATPSEEDIMSTRRLIEAGKILGCTLLDHVVMSREGYISIRTEYNEMWGE